MVRRSSLIFPVNVPRFLEQAWTRNADGITLDLEDAVAPAEKAKARTLIKDAIPIAARGGSEVSVRINHDTPAEDCEASVWPGLRSVNYPKTEHKEEIENLDRIITQLEKERGLPAGTVEISAGIESALGVWNAAEIVSASPRIKRFGGFGGGDAAGDLGLAREDQLYVDALGYGAGKTDLVSRAFGRRVSGGDRWRAGSTLIRGVGSEAARSAQIVEEAGRRNWRRGVRGGGSIHPSTVEPANRVFTPSAEDVQEARDIVEAFERAYGEGKGFGIYRGRVINATVANHARTLLDYAESCKERDREKAEAQEQVRRQQGAQ